MTIDREQIAARNARIQSAISQVRGHAQTPGGAVIVETDINGTITDLQISQSAMSVEPARLAKAISQCHETAKEMAQTSATKVYTEMLDLPELSPQKTSPTPLAVPTSQPVPRSQAAPRSESWEEVAPLRITHSF